MIRFSKVINKMEIIYTLDDMSIICRKTPKWEISISGIIDENKLVYLLDKVIKDLDSPICISLDNNLESSINILIKLNNLYPNIIFKVREEDINNIRKYMNDIKDNHLSIIIDYIIPSNKLDLESDLQVLRELDELYIIDDQIKRRFKLYSKKLNKIYLTKKLEEGVVDDPYSRAIFMYYLDRFGFKTTFEGTKELIESWEQDIRKYYQNIYFISKKRNLKVVQ